MPDQSSNANPPSTTAAPANAHQAWVRHWMPDDDLVEGFDRAGRPPGLRAFFAITIAASLTGWNLAFTYGAYHTVFYSRLFQILVVSSVLLLGSIVLRRIVHVKMWARALLGVPLLWLLDKLFDPLGKSSQAGRALNTVLIVLTVASVPFILWALARIIAPEYFGLPNQRLKAAVVFIVVLIAVSGFLVGRFNYRFTTCHQYILAGDYTPPNCEGTPSPTPTP